MSPETIKNMASTFAKRGGGPAGPDEAEINKLDSKFGQRVMERDFFSKRAQDCQARTAGGNVTLT